METKFCLVGEIGGKASLAQVPHAARAVTGSSGVNGLSPTFTFSLIFKCALFEILKGRNTSFIHTIVLNAVTRKFVVDFLIISLILVPPVDDVNLFLALFSIKNKKIPGNNQRLKLSFFSFRFS